MYTLIIVIVLIILNAFFVLAEFALLSAPKTLVEGKANQGSTLAKRLLEFIEDPALQDKYIGTAQLGITIASLGLGMFGEHALANWLYHFFNFSSLLGAHTVASLIAILILTYFHIVLGEMIPKSIALQSSERSLFFVGRPMILLSYLTAPFVICLNEISYFLLRLFGVKRASADTRFYTPDELDIIVEKSQEVGLIHKDSGNVIRDLLKFGDLLANAVMTPRVHVRGIPLGATAGEIKNLIAENAHTRYPVFVKDLDHIIGMIHIKELLAIIVAGKALEIPAVRTIPFLPGNTALDSVFQAMNLQRAQMAVVMDEHGGTAGIITTEDLFEEVVGEIEEDFRDPSETENLSKVTVRGRERLDEVSELIKIELQHPAVQTISGLVLAKLGRPPIVGDKIRHQGLEFRVIAIEGHGVAECQIRVRGKSNLQKEEKIQ